jgi:AcrR family transcriptional regulator
MAFSSGTVTAAARAPRRAAPTPAPRRTAPRPPARGAAATGRRAAHVEDTRRALLDTARALFAERGFQGTRTEEVVQRAGLTRGALYHHFRDKEDLFRAVHDEVAGEVVALLRRRSAERDARGWDLFRANSEVYLNAASTDGAYRQICLIDGPAVLGWQSWSERDGATAHIARYLSQAIAEGDLAAQPVEPLAHLLAALGVGAAMYVAHADDPVVARRQMDDCYERFVSGLGAPPPAGSGPAPQNAAQ